MARTASEALAKDRSPSEGSYLHVQARPAPPVLSSAAWCFFRSALTRVAYFSPSTEMAPLPTSLGQRGLALENFAPPRQAGPIATPRHRLEAVNALKAHFGPMQCCELW